MAEIIGLSILAFVFIVNYFLSKQDNDKRVRAKYSSELEYTSEKIVELKNNILKLKERTSNSDILQEIEQLELRLELEGEKNNNDLLLSVGAINKGNDYKYSSTLYRLKEDIEDIESCFFEIQETVYDESDNDYEREATVKTLVTGLYQRLKLKEYQYITEVNEKLGMYFYKELEEELKIQYTFIVGTAYQEIGKLKYANVYYEAFMDTIPVKHKDDKYSTGDIKLMHLIKELESLGLKYKVLEEGITQKI